MLTMLREWIGSTATMTNAERDVLDTIRPGTIPDPHALREELSRLHSEIAAVEAEWDRLDRRGDAAAFLQLQSVAERLQHLRAAAEPLPREIESAHGRRVAFVALTREFDTVAADVAARTADMLEHPPQDSRDRERRLRALDQATRIHSRLAGRLAAISTSRVFKDPVDALRVVRGHLELRITELDRLRLPGHKTPIQWPDALTALLDSVEGRTPRKDIV